MSYFDINTAPAYGLAHYDEVIMTTVASQITDLTIVYSIVYSDADQRKYQSSASLAFVSGEVPAQMASYAENDDVIMIWAMHDRFNRRALKEGIPKHVKRK